MSPFKISFQTFWLDPICARQGQGQGGTIFLLHQVIDDSDYELIQCLSGQS